MMATSVVDGADQALIVVPGLGGGSERFFEFRGIDGADHELGDLPLRVAHDGIRDPQVDQFAILAPPPGGSAPDVGRAPAGEKLAEPRAFLADEDVAHQMEAEHFFAGIAAQIEAGLVDPDHPTLPVGDELGRGGVERHCRDCAVVRAGGRLR